MSRNNYRQAKRNREETRKKRQLEKQQRKATRPDGDGDAAAAVVDPEKDVQETQPATETQA